MNENPLISVIVPVYKVEAYIKKCIYSIVLQTYKNLEIILVDDGSPDNSPAICDEFAKMDERIRVIHKENGGLATARNAGLEIATGEFITFVDSDDWLEADSYEKMIGAALLYPGKIVMCGRYNVEEESLKRSEAFSFDTAKIWTKEEALKRFFTWDGIDAAVCDKLFHKDFFQNLRFGNSKLICEDIPVTYELLKGAGGVVHIGKPKYNYLKRTGSISHSAYNERTIGLLNYPHAVYHDAKDAFPSLYKEASYYYLESLLNYMTILLKSNEKDEKSKKLLRKNLFAIIKNPYISLRKKVIAVLIASNLYGVASRVIKIIRRK